MAKEKEFAPMVGWAYDIFLWIFSIIIDLFFREVHPRGSWKIPRRGPVIFVAAPHANQFLDPLILMKVVHKEARRRIAFLIAAKSMKRRFVGLGASIVGAVPVARAMDSMEKATGKVYLPSPESDPLLVRGTGTDFEDKPFEKGGLVVLTDAGSGTASAEIVEIISKEELRVKKPFVGSKTIDQQLTGSNEQGEKGTTFKVAPHVDQTKVYDAVTERLSQGECVGIFPEGGSHDRTDLLPLKAGVAIMALDALAAHPDNDLKIIPVGMNYFHAHKFRSRAIVEFGSPLEIPPEVVQLYTSGNRREAVKRTLDAVYESLVAVTVTSPDYDTLMLIQAARRLYKPSNKKLPLPMVVELNRRLVRGYVEHKDDPRIVHLKSSVASYNTELRLLGLRDHQVEYARFSLFYIIYTLIYRVSKLFVLFIATLPGLVLFSPVFIATKVISIRKAKEALAASTVKVQARDVVATWKIMVAMAFAPMCYTVYTTVLLYWNYRNGIQGLWPQTIPWWVLMITVNVLFPTITFAALRFGEVGMDIFKSLRPLTLCLNPANTNTLVRLRRRREELSHEVTDVINTLGPKVYPDFERTRIVADPTKEDSSASSSRPTTPKSPGFGWEYPTFTGFFGTGSPGATSASSTFGPGISPSRPTSDQESFTTDDSSSSGSSSSFLANPVYKLQREASRTLPDNETFKNLASFQLFSSNPQTPNNESSRSRAHSRAHSRTNSGGLLTMHGYGSMDGLAMTSASRAQTTGRENGSAKLDQEELSLKIRMASKQRAKDKRRLLEDGGSDGLGSGSSGNVTPGILGELGN